MRRRALVTAGMGSLAAGLGWYVGRLAPAWLEVVRLRVRLPALPPELRGARIAHLTDFHVGGGVPLAVLRDAKARALAFEPDIVALTGDYYDDGRWSDAGDLFQRWPAGLPVVAVLGNHDQRGPAAHRERLIGELTGAGARVLINEATVARLRGTDVWIVGVDDPFSWLMDGEAAFGALPIGEDALLYLAHSPVAARTLPVGRARLTLTGHTHGGQLRIAPDGRVPFVRLARRVRRRPARPDPDVHRGVHWRRGTALIVSNGLGLSKLPWRFRTRPQVTLIELEIAAPDGPPCDDVARYVTRLNPPPVWLRWLS